MTELQEITYDKSSLDLQKELDFQIKMGESPDGKICGHIEYAIRLAKGRENELEGFKSGQEPQASFKSGDEWECSLEDIYY